MNKNYFLLLFVATFFSCVVSNANQNDMHSKAEKHIEKIKNIIKTNAENLPLKSVNAQNHLDSIVLNNGSLGVFYYNEVGLLTDYKGFSLDYNDDLKLDEHQQFEYDNAGRETLYVLNYNDAFDGWIIREKTESQYDANGNVLSEVYWDYDFGEAEHPSEKTEYQYDGNEVRSDSYEWDEDLEDWMHVSYSILLIDGLRPVSGEIFMYDYDAGELLPGMLIEFEYNSAGLETMYRLSMYDEESGENVVFNSSEYVYDSNNRLLVERETMQMPGFINLVNETRFTYENGNLIKKEEYSNDGYLPDLELKEYYEYAYNGNTLFSETYFLGQMDGSFVSTNKYEFIYDTSVNPDDYFIPYVFAYSEDYYHLEEEYQQFGLLKKVKHYTILDWETNEMAESMVADYLYSGGASVVISSDVSMSSIEIDGNLIEGFTTTKRSYNVELPTGTETPPVVSATASHTGASVTIVQADGLPGEATISVTAEDGETIVEYTIQFSVSVGVRAFNTTDIEIYPLPCSSRLTINNNTDCVWKSYEMVSVDGKAVFSGTLSATSKKYNIETVELENGIYILTVIFENKQKKYQRIIKQ